LQVPVDDQIWCNTLTQMQKADRYLNTATSPWTVQYRDKDTKAVLLTQTLKNTDGEDITSKNNIMGRLEKA